MGVTETGSGVSTWADQVGSHDLLQGTDANRPTLETDTEGRSVIAFSGATQYLETSGAFAVDRRACSVFVCMRSRCTGTTEALLHWGTASTELAVYQIAATLSGTFGVFSGAAKNSALRMGHGITAYGVSCGSAGSVAMVGDETAALTANNAGSTSLALRCGLWSGTNFPLGATNFDADIYEILVYSAELNATDYNAVLAYFEDTYNACGPSSETYLIVEGDSLTEGSTLEDFGRNNWAARLCGDPMLAWAPKLFNQAGGGEFAQAMATQTQCATELAANTYTNKVAVLWAGTNDINGGRTEAQIEADLGTIVSALQAAGATVYICTITPRTDFSSAEELIRVAVNAYILAGSTGADYTIDLAANTLLDDASDTTYYNVDGIHHNDAGVAVIADQIRDALVAQGHLELNAPPVVSSRNPTGVTKGSTEDVTITGTGFVDGIVATSNYAAAFTVNSTTFNSSTEVVVNVTGGSGTAGAYVDALTLMNPDGQSDDVALELASASGGATRARTRDTSRRRSP